MRPRTALTVLFLAGSATLNAQAVIDPGMSKAQVIAKLGPPSTQKSSGTSTFLYYRNGREKAVGMADLVMLDSDKVVDAVFRSAARSYSGKSSSPWAIPVEVARKHPQVAPPPSTPTAVPVPNAARPGAMKMPAERAEDVAKAIPQARSARLEMEKTAAARKADSAKTKADSAKAAKPDSAAKQAKKP
jgi:hypothetical protein